MSKTTGEQIGMLTGDVSCINSHINTSQGGHIMVNKSTIGNRSTECISVHVPKAWKGVLQKVGFDEDRSVNYLIKKAIVVYMKDKHNIKLKS